MPTEPGATTANIYIQPFERKIYEQLMQQFGFNLSVAIRYVTRDWHASRIKKRIPLTNDNITAARKGTT